MFSSDNHLNRFRFSVVCGEELKLQGHLGNAFQLVFVFAKRLNYR
ncbi:hypothetical protein VCRA2122O271_250065 [Vibrio crassostreae]|nr:hypothetical protein VCRA2121O264_390021 [Vibrio crassostreae]CAK3433695.1 hypothetical protein VCRA2122O271_250065 [Vibrio crassostreae]